MDRILAGDSSWRDLGQGATRAKEPVLAHIATQGHHAEQPWENIVGTPVRPVDVGFVALGTEDYHRLKLLGTAGEALREKQLQPRSIDRAKKYSSVVR